MRAEEKNGGYSPNFEEKAKSNFVVGKFKLSGDLVFHTIQGEGIFSGIPATFIRLNGCNLKCSRCDTRYTRKIDEKEFYESFDVGIEDLYKMIKNTQENKGLRLLCKNIVFTGGEPLLQQNMISGFIKEYPEFNVQIETNGTIPILKENILEKCYFNCSPKLKNSNNDFNICFRPAFLEQLLNGGKTIFKFVIKNKEDIDEVLSVYNFIPIDKIRFMPEGITKEENQKILSENVDYILSLGANICLRMQNIIWSGEARGV